MDYQGTNFIMQEEKGCLQKSDRDWERIATGDIIGN